MVIVSASDFLNIIPVNLIAGRDAGTREEGFVRTRMGVDPGGRRGGDVTAVRRRWFGRECMWRGTTGLFGRSGPWS